MNEVGYTWELYNKNYINTSDLCSKNLWSKCKLYHYHIIKEENHIYLNEEQLKQFHDFSLDNLIIMKNII